jgi:tripartite-type tricarboxylate transporter receptor subunit TctC
MRKIAALNVMPRARYPKLGQRRCATIFAALFVFAPVSADAAAQNRYPERPVTMVLATAPGGVADAVARLLQPVMQRQIGQPLVIEDKPGAAGLIGEGAVARAQPDGYTVLVNLEMQVINHVASPHPQYDALRDFAPVSLLAQLPHMIAVPSALKISTLKQFVALAKSKPGKLNFGTPGQLTSTYLETEEFMARAGISMVHVPYKGGPPVVEALMRDDVQLAILSLPPFRGAIQAGKITPLAVTGKTRLAEMPNIPTMVESGYPGFVAHTWIGAFVPAATSPAVIKKLHDAAVVAINDPNVRARLIEAGFEPVSSSPQQLGELVKDEVSHWGNFIKEHHIQFN